MVEPETNNCTRDCVYSVGCQRDFCMTQSADMEITRLADFVDIPVEGHANVETSY